MRTYRIIGFKTDSNGKESISDIIEWDYCKYATLTRRKVKKMLKRYGCNRIEFEIISVN